MKLKCPCCDYKFEVPKTVQALIDAVIRAKNDLHQPGYPLSVLNVADYLGTVLKRLQSEEK